MGPEGKLSTEDSSDMQDEAGQNKEGSELESVNSSDTNASQVQPSRHIRHVVCTATEEPQQKRYWCDSSRLLKC